MPRKGKVEEQLEDKKKKEKKRLVKKTPEAKKEISVPVYNLNGEKIDDCNLPKEIFSLEVKPSLLAQYVRVYLANQRQGTASTKTRGEVTASTRKIYRQKGTGRARHGSISAPIFVGGGIVGGPKPRDYSLKMNKKQKRKALFGALSLQFKSKNIIGIDDSYLKIKPKTKIFSSFLEKIGFLNQKILIVFPKLENNNLILAARNIPKVCFTQATDLNPYTVLVSQKIIFTEEGLKVLANHFLNENK